MRRLRFSVVFLMMVSAVTALDIAVMRSLFRHATGSNQTLYLVPIDGTNSIPFATLALGVLPMASLLVLAVIFQVPKIRRTGTVSGFWLGFETFGWLAVFLFMAGASLSPGAVQTYLIMVAGPVLSPLFGFMGNESVQLLADGIELATATFLLVLPELLIAAAGGCLFGRAGTRIVSVQVTGEASSAP
jgi:hypothetical protein